MRSPRELAAEEEELGPGANDRDSPDRTVHESQAGARQQVVRQRVAREAFEDTDHQHGDADQPVDLPRLAEGTGEEDAEAVGEHRGHEEHGGPVVHLPEQQAAPDVEGQGERRRVRLRHLDARGAAGSLPSYSISAIEGLNQMVRNTPLSSRTMKEYSAISPSRNDQWSGNTFRRNGRVSPASPIRSSAQLGWTGRDLEYRAELLRWGLGLRPSGSSSTVAAAWPSVIACLEVLAGVPFKIARSDRDNEATLGRRGNPRRRRDR